MMKSDMNGVNNNTTINNGNTMMNNNNVLMNGNNMNNINYNNNNNHNNSVVAKDYYDRLTLQTGKGITLATIQQHQLLTRQQSGKMHDSNRSFLSGNDAIQNSQLSASVKTLMHRLFVKDNELDKSFIEEPSIRLLEEISEEEQHEAINEFVDRYRKAKHKIKKSKPGYFRGVCQKYWKQNREKKNGNY